MIAGITTTKQRIYRLIESLPAERLPVVLDFLTELRQPETPESVDAIPPIYQLHLKAEDVGIADLASQHDHYLYGVSKDDD